MTTKFNPARLRRLMSAERRKQLPPDKILREIGLQPGATVVDIGAGPGFFALEAAHIVGPAGRIFGLDILPVMIGELKKNARRMGLSNIRAILVPETPADFPVGADLYLIVNTLHEFKDKAGYLRRIRGRMILSSRLVIIDFLKKKTAHGPPLRERIPLAGIASLLARAGLFVERIFRPNDEEYGIVARLR